MRKLRLPVLALVAVVLAVALAGPAFGGSGVSGSASALATAKKALRTAKSAKRLAARAWTVTGPQGPAGKDGRDGKDGIHGKDGTNGTNGTNGKDGADGTALGYAQISGGPTVLKGKNVAQSNVSSPTPGYFCFYNLPFTPNVANATLTHPTTGNPAVNTNTYSVSARVGGDDPTCPGTEQASVVTNNSAGTLGNAEFQIVFN
jgi:hypothetical protein